jgi:hypothetical protein
MLADWDAVAFRSNIKQPGETSKSISATAPGLRICRSADAIHAASRRWLDSLTDDHAMSTHADKVNGQMATLMHERNIAGLSPAIIQGSKIIKKSMVLPTRAASPR